MGTTNRNLTQRRKDAKQMEIEMAFRRPESAGRNDFPRIAGPSLRLSAFA
jgi:hypothetical protein